MFILTIVQSFINFIFSTSKTQIVNESTKYIYSIYSR